MTSFGDVNVGDKVRLTRAGKTIKRHEFEVEKAGAVWLKDDDGLAYHEADWSVEVLEPAPKPLPTEPGFYRRNVNDPKVPGAYLRTVIGKWIYVYGDGEVGEISEPHAEFEGFTLTRLVPESAVEEARAEVVKEIVAELRGQDLLIAAQVVKNMNHGGKA